MANDKTIDIDKTNTTPTGSPDSTDTVAAQDNKPQHSSHEIRNEIGPLDMAWVNNVHLNTQSTQRDAADITGRRAIKKEHQVAWLLKAMTMIDLTTLSGDDTPGNVKKLCAEALQPLPAKTLRQLKNAGLNIQTGAVCIYHNHIKTAGEALLGTTMPIAAVSTGFPHAQNPFSARLREIKESVADGATEIDVVITREHVLTGNWARLHEEISLFREACGESHMKVIFETGELGSMENVAKASRVAMMAGADFIKTSTGKASLNANLAVSLVMMNQIRDYYDRTGIKIGFKPAGGISTAKDALAYMTLVKEVLGDDWLTPELFRFGASSLLKDIKRQLYHQATGNYADVDYTEQRAFTFDENKLAKIVDIYHSNDYGSAPESDAEAMAWLKDNNGRFGHFIGGDFIPGKGKNFTTESPSDGRTLAMFKNATRAEIDDAVTAAQKAQQEWAQMPGFKKKQFMYALARQVQKHAKLFSVLESLDNGKPFRETFKVDIPLVARHLRYHAGMAQIMDEKFPNHEPYGVAGQIIPWNFPLLMLAWKVAPALAAGNAVVLKPAEQTPLTAMLFAQICKDAAEEAGAPKGLVNIVNGDGKVGAAIVNHDGIDKIAFTGSTEVGRIIMNAAAGTGKGLTLELGGKSPFIVFEDADLDAAVEGVVNAIWFNQGEVCCGGSRLLIQESVYDQFINKLKNRMEKLRVGHALDKSVDVGAVISKQESARIDSMVADAAKEGAEIYQPAYESCNTAESCFYPPTLVTNVDPTDTIMQEEVFGPVVCATSFRTHEEAIKLANHTTYGLAASVWTEKADKANEVAAQINAGVIWTNGTNNFDAAVGFGGNKESGFGREGGDEGMLAYMKPKDEMLETKADVSAPRTDYERTAPGIDTTPKNYVGGKQARPDSGYSKPVVSHDGQKIGDVGVGNRKDIRNAVEAAAKAASWAAVPGDTKSQILDFMGENLSKRADEFAARLQNLTGCSIEDAHIEVQKSIEAIFNAAAWSDKYEGPVHRPPGKTIVPTLNEPKGIIGISCPNENPLLSMVSMVSAAIAMGNRVVLTPSEKYPLLATDFYQVLDTSDVPGGVVNIVTGGRDELADTLSRHDKVNAVWYHGSAEGSAMVQRNAANSNLKQAWVNCGKTYDWSKMAGSGMRQTLLPRATQVKNIWVPFGEGVGPK
ncbi:MAG: deoxyribose-phosphate aldolase [Rhodospirillales bacterium]|nr:deoxyribose-phosphate aldolase [Rhodospirillales bacterium]MCB9995910.1 deoxyribose-phosphate aldolase [Rhodospirillales bacterium]